MKKFMTLLVPGLILSLLLVIVGCEKNSEDQKVVTFIVTPTTTTIMPNESTTLVLNVENVFSITTDIPEFEMLNIGGVKKTINIGVSNISVNTVFHLTAIDVNGKSTSKDVQIFVTSVPKPTAHITSDPVEIVRGEVTSIKWYSTNADSVLLSGVGIVGLSGEIEIRPQETKVYTLTAYGKGGTATDNVLITVNEPYVPTGSDTLKDVTRKKMKLESQEYPSAPWVEVELRECDKDDLITFYTTPNKVLTDYGELSCGYGIPRTVTEDWSLVGNLLTIGNVQYTLEINTHDTTVRVYKTGLQSSARETYVAVP